MRSLDFLGAASGSHGAHAAATGMMSATVISLRFYAYAARLVSNTQSLCSSS